MPLMEICLVSCVNKSLGLATCNLSRLDDKVENYCNWGCRELGWSIYTTNALHPLLMGNRNLTCPCPCPCPYDVYSFGKVGSAWLPKYHLTDGCHDYLLDRRTLYDEMHKLEWKAV